MLALLFMLSLLSHRLSSSHGFVRSTARASGIRSFSKMIEATDLFDTWAKDNRDEKMACGHEQSVSEMFTIVQPHLGDSYSMLDIGCGNGWVTRQQRYEIKDDKKGCYYAKGIDGAPAMIKKAIVADNDFKCEFENVDITTFAPDRKFDLAFSMEVFYYLSELQLPLFLKRVHDEYLEDQGLFLFGIDHYLENEDCHDWAELNNTPMLLWPEEKWREVVEGAGFAIMEQSRVGVREDMRHGTMSILARKQ